MSLRHREELTLPERIYRYAEAVLSVKEVEYLGKTRGGSLPERIDVLADTILRRLEEKYSVKSNGIVPNRVKALRRKVIEKQESVEEDSAEDKALRDDLWDINLVTQLYSYPGDYVSEKPTVERLAETLDKLEEDVRRLLQVIKLSQEEAIITRQQFEIKFGTEYYEFYRFDKQSKEFITINDPAVLRRRELDSGYEIKLFMDDTSISLDEKDSGRISIFPSGELTPFELHLSLPDSDIHYKMTGTMIGDISVEDLQTFGTTIEDTEL